MAAKVPIEVPTVNLKDLDEDLVKLWLSKLSVTEQTAVTRVCKSFTDNAYKLTTIMYANDLPDDFRINILPRMPKLKTICYSIKQNMIMPLDTETVAFLESVAMINPNIRLIEISEKCKYFFIKKCKEYHNGYDGSKFKGLLNEFHYERLLVVYPDIKVRHRVQLHDLDYSPRTMEERLSDPCLSALRLETESLNHDSCYIKALAKHLTILNVTVLSITAKPNYSYIFNSVAGLPLKDFTLLIGAEVAGKVYGWKKRDTESFKNLLQLESLVDICLNIPIVHRTYLITLKCFLECPRNNFHHFSSSSSNCSSSGYDLNVSPFHELAERSQYRPSMEMCLQEEGGINDSFPMAKFIQKFNPKYREFLFKDRSTMIKMIHPCADLIKDQPKLHFVFYTRHGSDFLMSFRPIQFEPECIKFSTELIPRRYVAPLPSEEDQEMERTCNAS